MLSSLCNKMMSLMSGKFKTSTIPIDKLNDPAVLEAASKPTYKNYKFVLAHRRTLQSFKTKLDLMVKAAYDVLFEAVENHSKTYQTLTDVCDFTKSPFPTTRPSIAGDVLQTIIELQVVYSKEKEDVLLEYTIERGYVLGRLGYLNSRIRKMERALVKKYGIHTVDDEGNPLDMQNVEVRTFRSHCPPFSYKNLSRKTIGGSKCSFSSFSFSSSSSSSSSSPRTSFTTQVSQFEETMLTRKSAQRAIDLMAWISKTEHLKG